MKKDEFHVTILYRGDKVSQEEKNGILAAFEQFNENQVVVMVVALVYDDKGAALVVELPDEVRKQCQAKHPHITIGCAPRVPPKYSNDLLEKPAKEVDVAIVYSKHYDINLGGMEQMHAFDIHKHGKVVAQLRKDRLIAAAHIHEPRELSRQQILTVHSAEYLDKLKDSSNVGTYLEAPAIVDGKPHGPR